MKYLVRYRNNMPNHWIISTGTGNYIVPNMPGGWAKREIDHTPEEWLEFISPPGMANLVLHFLGVGAWD